MSKQSFKSQGTSKESESDFPHLQYIVDDVGERKAVIIPVQQFHELLEDLKDLAAVAECREEPTISHEELLVQLKQDGLLLNLVGIF